VFRATTKSDPRFRKPFEAPVLFALSDPDRGLPALELARNLGPDHALVYRHFGDPEAINIARQISRWRDRQGFSFLMGSDPDMAVEVGADGVHMAERSWRQLPQLRRSNPRWLISIAAHSSRAANRFLSMGADVILRSSILSSPSPSAGRPVGIVRLAQEARLHSGSVIALGGATPQNTGRLFQAGAVGLASVSATEDFLKLRHFHRHSRVFGPIRFACGQIKT
jgi:thiamine-phosphate pyrophosphorylase